MVSLIDVAPTSEEVLVRGKNVSVYGVSVKGVAILLSRFPELQALFQGKSLEVENIVDFGVDVIAAIIAAGTGAPGSAEVEKVAESLSVDEQAGLLEAIIRLTLPRGLGPFVERISVLTGSLGIDADASTKALDTNLRDRSKD